MLTKLLKYRKFFPKIYRNKNLETFCGVLIENPKLQGNVGVLFRTCANLGNINFLGTIGTRYDKNNHSDPLDSHRILPCWYFENFVKFYESKPLNCELVGVELDKSSISLEEFEHPKRAVYIFGNEGYGLEETTKKRCKYLIKLPSSCGTSMNLSSSGSIVLWDRYIKSYQSYKKG